MRRVSRVYAADGGGRLRPRRCGQASSRPGRQAGQWHNDRRPEALHLAVRRGDLASVRLLLAAGGANPNLKSTFQQAYGTPLDIARGIGNDEMEKLLREHGAK